MGDCHTFASGLLSQLLLDITYKNSQKWNFTNLPSFLLSFTLFYFLYHGHSQPLKAQCLPIQNGAHKLLKGKQAWLPTQSVELGAFGEGMDSCLLGVLVSRLITRMTWLVTHHAGSLGLQFPPHHFCSFITASHQVAIIGDTEK